jgi:3-oxoacyl-[acyl-carrier protein] reductase
LSERRVLITGASKGIGRAIAIQLAADGFEIVAHYNTDEVGARQTLEQISAANGRCHLLQFNVKDRDVTRTVLETEIETNGSFYGIVSNAGVVRDNAFPAMPGDEWDEVIHTNLDSFYNVIHPCVMPMVQLRKGGRIVVMSSVSGVTGNRGQVNYSASKAGLIGASKALAVELAKRRITVNCVAPGLIDTEMVDDEILTEALKMIPARRMGTPEEVAGLVSYLMSDAAAYVTRQAISINGGMI